MTTLFNIDYARAEIEQRNLIRREAQLPPVSVARELRRLINYSDEPISSSSFRHPLSGSGSSKSCCTNERLRDDPQWKDEEADGTHLANATTIVGRGPLPRHQSFMPHRTIETIDRSRATQVDAFA
jgi:hypothetical protein